MLLNVWTDFSHWVSVGWSNLTYIIIVSVFAIVGLLALLSFFKKSFDKGKKPKWGMLVLSIIMFALLAVIFAAKYA